MAFIGTTPDGFKLVSSLCSDGHHHIPVHNITGTNTSLSFVHYLRLLQVY